MTVQARGGGHRPSLVDTVPRFEIDSESKEHELSSGRVEIADIKVSPTAIEIAESDVSSTAQQDKLLNFQKQFPPGSRVSVTWEDPVTDYSGRIIGKGRLDKSGKAIFQVLYDVGGKKFWHEIDSTPVTKAVIKLKTLVVEGEKSRS